MKIFVDLDGVLCDFVQGACDAWDMPNPYTKPENFGNFDIAKVSGIPPEIFWKKCSGHEFWANLPKTPDADAIMERITFDLNDIAFLTANSLDPFSASGKLTWVKRHYPRFHRKVIITPAKHFIAHSNALLIDDRDENCREFRAEGGRAILLPRPWNSTHGQDVLAVLDAGLNYHVTTAS